MADTISRTLGRTEKAYTECAYHLQTSGAEGSPIESFLTEHILILLCADMQRDILEIADRRATSASDGALHTFVSNAGTRILRSVRKTEIAAFVGLFGRNYKNDFNDTLDDRDVQLYDNAVQERHKAAHSQQGSNIGFRELGDVIDAARNILDSMQRVLLT